MAPRKDASSSSDSDSDVPEAIPLSQSKKQIQKLESSRKNAVLAERQSRKTQNRERDRKLKERAEKNKKPMKDKGKGKEEESEQDDNEEEVVDGLEARMLRAMKDAQEEEDEDDEEGFEGFGNVQLDEDEDEDESGSQDSEEDDSEEEEEEEEEEEVSDDDDESRDSEESEGGEEPERPSKPQTSTKFNPDHLPDALFEAAFASQTGNKRTFTDDADITPKSKTSPHAAKKRKTNPKTPKDIIVGSKAIRLLPSSALPPAPSTLPSRKINNFLNRTLAFKGGKQRARGWERRPANIGVLRGAGPALNFVRNK